MSDPLDTSASNDGRRFRRRVSPSGRRFPPYAKAPESTWQHDMNVVDEAIPNLPQDVVTEVLVRLPVKSLQKFRSVCKPWDSLIGKDDYLASQQLKYSRERSPIPKKPGLLTELICSKGVTFNCEYTYGLGLGDYTIQGYDKIHNFGHLVNQQFVIDGSVKTSIYITNSCDGLVGVYSLDNFCMVNPSIRKIQVLPKGSPSNSGFAFGNATASLGFDSLTGKYKVVRFFHREFVGTGCEVLSLGGDDGSHSWRIVEDPPVDPHPGVLPVVVNGSMYWTRNESPKMGIVAISFDLSTEKFGVVKHSLEKKSATQKMLVAQLHGYLCVAHSFCSRPSYMMDLWLLKDYRNTKWVKQYTINLTNVGHAYLQPVTTNNGIIVLHEPQGPCRYYYDPQTKRFGHQVYRFAADHCIRGVWITPYTESMIWPW